MAGWLFASIVAPIVLISGWTEVACAQLFTFTKIADNNTAIPGGSGTFTGFVPPV